MILGTVLVIAALSLFIWNLQEANEAASSSQEVVLEIAQQIQTRKEEATAPQPTGEDVDPTEYTAPDPYDPYMTEVLIKGHYYIGYLSIPSLSLELPVMSEWSYLGLYTAPCRYSGSTKTDDLSIVAHNYGMHFGHINELVEGDSVIFTDMDGIVTCYQVVLTDILPPDAVEDVVNGDFDLTLVTCTYGGRSRIAVYCNEVI